jgi:superfamily II RNA helicase
LITTDFIILSKMLRSCDLSKEPEHKVTDYAIHYPYKLDIFQEHAISAIDQGHNVLVTAPTGSGKTIVAEYAIAHCLRQGKRVFYTTPIKSLSNQKFHDLKTMWPQPGIVGIMTGDIKFCPDARIIIMTTEILRNLLYKQGTSTEHVGLTASLSLQDLGAVVFDECHYINDRDRGKVWEETMILLPPQIQLVMLSATLDRPEMFAEWLGELKQTPCHLIQTQYRVVPLIHSVLRGSNLYTIMDEKEVFYDQQYADWLRNKAQTEKDHEAYQRKVAAARRAGTEGAIGGKVKSVSFSHQLNRCIEALHEQGMLPALAFVLSRKGCEQHAHRVETDLLDSSDASAAQHIFDFHLRHHKESLETLPQYHHLRKLIVKGIAFHHSGVLPLLKEVIEILFTKGYIKLLFCTETFAVGINMPTKTVIFTGFHKYDDSTGGMRLLRTDEYIQMAGRAGRRGKDPKGQVILLPEREPPTVTEMRFMLKGGRPQIESRMDFHYNFLLKTFQTKQTKWLEIQEKSYWYRLRQLAIQSTQKELEKLKTQGEGIVISQDVAEALEEKEMIEQLVATMTNAKRKDAQRRLVRWEEEHRGETWKRQEERWKQTKELKRQIASLEDDLTRMAENRGSAEIWIAILQEAGFLDSEKVLTPKGILATECNEGHSLISAEMFQRGLHKSLTGHELVTVLACFMADKEDENSPSIKELGVSIAVKETMYQISDLTDEIQRIEDKRGVCSPGTFWGLTTTWIEPISQWLQGKSASSICAEYGLFEGNFVRSVLRVSNIVEEWQAMATLTQDLETLEKLAGIRPELVRDIIQPDSLYLHL